MTGTNIRGAHARRSRVLITGLLTAAMLSTGTAAAHAWPAAAPNDEPTVIAHRGASAQAPENTLPAVELGTKADFVEVDVQMTKDGELVVIHDTTLDRTTDVESKYPDRAPYNVGDFTLAEIRTLDAGSWFSDEYAGTRIPTLEEVLDTLRGRAGLLLEVKSPALYPGIAEAIVAELDGEGWLRANPRSGRLIVQSFNWDFMAQFNSLAPKVPAGLLGGPPSEAEMAELSTWADQINPNHNQVDAEFIDTVHEYGMVTWPYTVDDPARMGELAGIGVDGIITNHPAVLIEVLREGPGLRDAA
ncbi:glycerophosphodiester phosphodiesterase [Arthrobacter castelli]|uniref:glycerophosphodiester phosphodiesterase n=1 Tax=Arthrobacter castelli TaxID=271431 RepID=UPI00040CD16C|nr:glycerophosphodiester phosphodiesterase family protein [Arthrobacter castelli]